MFTPIKGKRLENLLHALPVNIALLNKAGIIEFTNHSWNKFAVENFGDSSKVGVGASYFQVCDDSELEGLDAMQGIRKVLKGELDFFTLEYPCHSPDKNRWFILSVNPVKDSEGGAVVSHVNITDQVEAEVKIRNLTLAIEQSFSSVMFTDKHGKIEYVNSMFEKTSGYSLKEIMGKTPNFLKSGKHHSAFYMSLWENIASGKEHRSEVCNKSKSGELYWEDQSITPIRDDEGDITHYLSVQFDITKTKLAQEKLESSNRELQDITQFASHDLREPIRKIVILSDQIKTEMTDKSSEDFKTLGRIQSSAYWMNELIQDLVLLSRLSATSESIQKIDLNVVLDDILQELDREISDSQGRVTFKNLPQVKGNSTQIRQLFHNLIGNALKFHLKDKPPEIQIGQQSLDQAGIKLFVKDNGIGFDQKYSERIFHTFERLHPKDQYGGTGIGLAICKKVVENHGWQISVESAIGKGTTFIIKLPPEDSSS
jgi:PAS domain S-box-containing protein